MKGSVTGRLLHRVHPNHPRSLLPWSAPLRLHCMVLTWGACDLSPKLGHL